MLAASIIFFAIAAVYGVWLAGMFLKNKPVTPGTALGHGIVAAIGLVLLLIIGYQLGFTTLSGWSVILFIVAVIGGVVMFYLHLTKGAPPVQIIVVHALAAVAGFLLLLIYAFGK